MCLAIDRCTRMRLASLFYLFCPLPKDKHVYVPYPVYVYTKYNVLLQIVNVYMEWYQASLLGPPTIRLSGTSIVRFTESMSVRGIV